MDIYAKRKREDSVDGGKGRYRRTSKVTSVVARSWKDCREAKSARFEHFKRWIINSNYLLSHF